MSTLLEKVVRRAVYQEEPGSTFSHEGNRYDLNKILRLVHRRNVKRLPVDKFKWILQHDNPWKDLSRRRRTEYADLTKPIVYTIYKGKHLPVDGVHRISKAVGMGVTVLPAKHISEEELEQARVGAMVERVVKASGILQDLRQKLYFPTTGTPYWDALGALMSVEEIIEPYMEGQRLEEYFSGREALKGPYGELVRDYLVGNLRALTKSPRTLERDISRVREIESRVLRVRSLPTPYEEAVRIARLLSEGGYASLNLSDLGKVLGEVTEDPLEFLQVLSGLGIDPLAVSKDNIEFLGFLVDDDVGEASGYVHAQFHEYYDRTTHERMRLWYQEVGKPLKWTVHTASAVLFYQSPQILGRNYVLRFDPDDYWDQDALDTEVEYTVDELLSNTSHQKDLDQRISRAWEEHVWAEETHLRELAEKDPKELEWLVPEWSREDIDWDSEIVNYMRYYDDDFILDEIRERLTKEKREDLELEAREEVNEERYKFEWVVLSGPTHSEVIEFS